MSPEPAAAAYGRGSWARLVRRLDPFLVVATVVAAGSLAWRRTRPRASYGGFVAGALVVSGSGRYIGLLSLLCCSASGVPDLRTRDLLLAIALLVATWAVGEVVRTRRELQRDQVRAASTEERLRIARELHDVVAHSMSLSPVQAGVGAHVIRTDPAGAGRALEVIAETSRRALEQTRSMLGMLREEDEDGNRPPAWPPSPRSRCWRSSCWSRRRCGRPVRRLPSGPVRRGGIAYRDDDRFDQGGDPRELSS